MRQKINYPYLIAMLVICHFISVKLEIMSLTVCRVYSCINYRRCSIWDSYWLLF